MALAESEDIQRIAKDEGLSSIEAEKSFGWQNGFSLAATAVEEAFPDSFANAQIIQKFPPKATERDELIIAVHRAVSKDRLSGRFVSTMMNEETGKVESYVTPTSGALERSLIGITREITEKLPSALRPHARIVIDKTQPLGGEARFGGGFLDTGTSYPTAGFNVIRPTGTVGIATAGHCPNSVSHRNTPTATAYPLTYHWAHQGAWGDFQWHSSATETHPNDFYYSAGVRRDALTYANPSDDQTICRFGQTTGAQCNQVDNLSVCVTYDGVEHCRLVQMKNHEADGGDSGGPWYWGNTAYGIHSGDRWYLLFHHDVWSRATYLDEALSVTVRTS